MPVIECPQCGTRVEGKVGSRMTCPQCGFSADYRAPRPAAATPASEAPAGQVAARISAPTPTHVDTMQESPKKIPGPWAYVLGVVALGTFWAAEILVPFAFGVAAVVLGVMARRQTPADKRGWPAIALGVLAILAAGVFLAV